MLSAVVSGLADLTSGAFGYQNNATTNAGLAANAIYNVATCGGGGGSSGGGGGGKVKPRDKIVTSQGNLLTTMTKGDTKLFLKQTWDQGTFASELDTAAYHLNKHGRGATIQEYTEAAQKFYREFRRTAEAVPSMRNPSQTVYRIRNSSGMGIFTKEGKIITYEPTIWPK